MNALRMNARGQTLAMTIILLLIMLSAATMLTRLMLNRYTLTAKTNSSMEAKFLTQSAEHMVYACLQGSQVAAASCDASAYQSCFPSTIGGKAVAISMNGTPPQCNLRVSVQQ